MTREPNEVIDMHTTVSIVTCVQLPSESTMASFMVSGYACRYLEQGTLVVIGSSDDHVQWVPPA